MGVTFYGEPEDNNAAVGEPESTPPPTPRTPGPTVGAGLTGRRRVVAGILLLGFVVLLIAGIFLVTAPRGEPFRLSTHCGITGLLHEGQWYERVGGTLADDDGLNAPRGWDNPEQEGRLRVSDGTAVFTDWAGHRETFILRVRPYPGQSCR